MRMEAFLFINAIYLLTATILTAIIFLIFRFLLKEKTWYLTDLFMVLFPGILYSVLYITRLHRLIANSKTLSNLIVELIVIGLGCGATFFLRAMLGKKFPNYSKKFSLLGILLMVVLTVSVYIFTPSLPE